MIFRRPKNSPDVQSVPIGLHFLKALGHAATALSYLSEEPEVELQRKSPARGNKPPCCIHKRKK
jgi:hypothetical protein